MQNFIIQENSRGLPLLPEDEKKRAINNSVKDTVVPTTLKTVLKWIRPKDSSKSYCDFLFNDVLVNESSKVRESWLKKWNRYTECKLSKDSNGSVNLDQSQCKNSDSNYKLDQKDCQNYDSQLLVQILICLLEHSDISDNSKKSVIETLGKALNTIRNGVAHDPDKAATSPTPPADFNDALKQLVETAGDVCRCPQEEILSVTNFMNEEIERIKKSFNASDSPSLRVAQTEHLLATSGRQALSNLQHKMNLTKSPMPLCEELLAIELIFHHFKLARGNEIFSLKELFPVFATTKTPGKIFIIEGAAGAGKTTLLNQIAFDFLSPSDNEEFKHIKKFQSLMFIRGNDRSVSSLAGLLKRMYGTVLDRTTIDHVKEAILKLKILILVDGLDELNEVSGPLLEEVLRHFKTSQSVTLLATSRSHAVVDFQNKARSEGILCERCSIREISTLDDQKEFINKYQMGMQDYVDPNIEETFCEMEENLRGHFVRPIELALYCVLAVRSETRAANLTSLSKIMRETCKLYRSTCMKKLTDDKVNNPLFVRSVVLGLLFKSSLKCLVENELYLSMNRYEALCNDSLQTLKSSVNVTGLLSCILYPGELIGDQEERVFNFSHKHQAEYFAALAITSELEKKGDLMVGEVVNSVAGEKISDDDLERK